MGVAALCLGGTAIAAEKSPVYQSFDTFSEAYARTRENYIHPVPDKELMEHAIAGLLSGLDPHSSYMTAKRFAAMQSHTAGSEAGIGLTITVTGAGLVKVVAPIDGAPAAAAGIKAGDYIAEIDGTATENLSVDDVEDLLRGPAGTTMHIVLMRRGADTPIELAIERAVVILESVKAERKGDIGYVRISSMDNNCTQRVARALNQLKKAGALKGYVLDLRNDPGGLLDEAAGIADLFLDKGDIFSALGRHKDDTQRYGAHRGDLTDGKPLVVLVNEGSAAGAEIVAGALQDQKRATLIGTRTFGSGTIQTIIPLGENNGALRLTTSQIYLPSGRTFQAAGLDPDVFVSMAPKGTITAERPKREAALADHLPAAKTAPPQSTIIYPDAGSTDGDFQLTFALSYLAHRK